jgi:pyruvate/2-oxoglutarate dehydrogenase complex dihydrolipoamide dehydrogenase (E3) component
VARYQYDLTVLGGGSGGLTAARLAAALGARVLLIDKERLGGDCLHYGCVPSKALIHLAKLVAEARASAALGLVSADLKVDMARVSGQIQQVIARVAEGEQVYVQGVSVRFGQARFRSPRELELNGETVLSNSFLIATGSRPRVPPVPGLREAGYLTNESIFDLQRLPPSLVVAGGGPVGVEMAQAFARLGSQVTLFQSRERLLPREEPEVSAAIAEALAKDGVRVILHTRLEAVSQRGAKKIARARQGEKLVQVEADDLLIALGRAPNLEDLNLAAAGVASGPSGIVTDAYLRATAANIYAIGDVIGGYLFTHVAAYQAGVAVRNALVPVGRKRVDYRVLPWVTFTDPEAARLGLTEEQARKTGQPVRVIRLPWHAIDRAQTEGQLDGFIKLIVPENGDQILGAHIVGARAGELLGELALAMQHRLGLSKVLATIHAYPTLSTGLQQAAWEWYLGSSALSRARKLIRPLLSWRG